MTEIETQLSKKGMGSRLIEWYLIDKKSLPWSNTKDSYRIWLSEIVLQQTRVNQGLPYYQAFVQTFDSIVAFATASLDEILKLWQGLGYYAHAKNTHECVQTIMNSLGGEFPDSYGGVGQTKRYRKIYRSDYCFHLL